MKYLLLVILFLLFAIFPQIVSRKVCESQHKFYPPTEGFGVQPAKKISKESTRNSPIPMRPLWERILSPGQLLLEEQNIIGGTS